MLQKLGFECESDQLVESTDRDPSDLPAIQIASKTRTETWQRRKKDEEIERNCSYIISPREWEA